MIQARCTMAPTGRRGQWSATTHCRFWCRTGLSPMIGFWGTTMLSKRYPV